MKFGKFLYSWLALSVLAAFVSAMIPGALIISLALVNLFLVFVSFILFVYIYYDIFDDIKELSIKNAVHCMFYLPDFEKMSKDMELIIKILENRVIADPDKIHKFTIESLAKNIRQRDILTLVKYNINLPIEKRVKICKFYRKQKSLLVRIENIQKCYVPALYNDEYKKLTERASEFTVNLAEILDDCWMSLDTYESFEWLKGHGYID